MLLAICAAAAAAVAADRLFHPAVLSSLTAQPEVFQVQVPPRLYGGGSLAEGSCLGYRPLEGDRHQTVFIDPGHGGLDPGTSGVTSSGDSLLEKDLTLTVALDLRDDLRHLGYTVVVARTRDSSVIALGPDDQQGGYLTSTGAHRDAEARIACADTSGAKALISLHFNGFDDPSVGGAETYYDDARTFDAGNLRLATLVQQHLVAALHAGGWPVPDLGVLTDDGVGNAYSSEATTYGHLYLLGPAQAGWNDHPSLMPGTLTEPLFITRPSEGDVAASRSGQAAIAAGLAAGVDAFLRGAPTPPSPPPS